MTRLIQDDDLRTWEAFATTGEYGGPRPARVVFRCRSVPGERPRQIDLEGDKSDAEEAVARMSASELRDLLAQSKEID